MLISEQNIDLSVPDYSLNWVSVSAAVVISVAVIAAASFQMFIAFEVLRSATE